MTPHLSAGRPALVASGPRAAVAWALVGLVGVGFALRIIGIRFGLPAVYNPDEVAIMSRALAFATGDLNPHNFLYPTLYFYVLFGWLGVSFVMLYLVGAVGSVADFQRLYFVDPTTIYFAGRLLGAVCGTLTLVATYALGRRLAHRGAALAAALFLAVAPFHVRDSHYVKHDVPVTLAVVLAYLAIARLWSEDTEGHSARRRDVIVAAIACGVAFSTHYYTIFLIVPLALAIWLSAGPRRVFGRLTLAIGTSAVVFFLGSPFVLVEPRTAWRDIVANRQIVMDRAVSAGGAFSSAGHYLQMLWGEALGWPVVVLALLGLGLLARRSPRRTLLLLAFPVPFFAFIANTVTAGRYLDPILPFVAVLAGAGVAGLARVAGRRATHRRIAAALLASAAVLPGVRMSLRADFLFRQEDTRTIALRFIENGIPDGETIAIQPYSVPLTQSRASLEEALVANLGDARRASIKFRLRMALDPYPTPAYRTIYLGSGGLDLDKIYVAYDEFGAGAAGLDALRRLGVHYVVLKRYNGWDPVTMPLVEALAREGRQMAVFSPYRPGAGPTVAATVEPFLHNTDARIDVALERPGPVIEIWRLDDFGSQAS